MTRRQSNRLSTIINLSQVRTFICQSQPEPEVQEGFSLRGFQEILSRHAAACHCYLFCDLFSEVKAFNVSVNSLI